ncbi:MAG: HAD family hydrolase [Pirellula sp.]|jgi:phosphoglycolate phosphatase
MRFDGIIFDLDGTLLDSIEDIGTATNRVLAELGKPTHAISAYQYLVGDGVSVLFQRALPETIEDPGLRSRCMEMFEIAYSEEWNKRSKPYDGIPGLLNSLVVERLRVGVLSNKPEEFTKRCSSYFFPTIPFDLVVGHSDRFPRKPDPSSARWMAEQWEVDSNRIAYVGDTNTDMKTAVGAGFFAIGVTWGFRPESELREHGAMQLVHSARELQEFLLAD